MIFIPSALNNNFFYLALFIYGVFCLAHYTSIYKDIMSTWFILVSHFLSKCKLIKHLVHAEENAFTKNIQQPFQFKQEENARGQFCNYLYYYSQLVINDLSCILNDRKIQILRKRNRMIIFYSCILEQFNETTF